VPVRLILRIFNLNELNSLRLTNFFILSAVNFFILKRFLKSNFKKLVYLVLIYFSPLIFFLSWPGVDVFYTSLLLLAIFFFYKRKYLLASVLTALASWHSQPLIVISLGFLAGDIFKQKKINLGAAFITAILLLIPYGYNDWAFGTLTPWTIFAEGWTQKFGFGLQNASLKKFFELFFDLNMGLFWYAPFIFILGVYNFFKHLKKDKKNWLVLILLVFTSFVYQTNSAWHYGTAGYGPSRHSLYLLPFLVYFVVKYLGLGLKSKIFLFAAVLTQVLILSFNGFLMPNFEHTLYHSPYARFVLNNFPYFYNPTPEIFVDRTNHEDRKYMTSAIYRFDGVCKKAYILDKDIDKLISECGFIPEEMEKKDMFGGSYVNY